MKSLKRFLNENLSTIPVNEGGAAGHMLHPFELDFIWNKNDVVRYFERLKSSLKDNIVKTFVKLDGTNCSIRARDDMFVLDRLTKNPLDINGMTAAEIDIRFKDHAHGYDIHAKKVLSAFNRSFGVIKPYMKRIGLLDNPNLMLNIEFIDRNLGLIGSDKDYIAIHGLLEIYYTSTGSRKTKEVKADVNVLEKIATSMSSFLDDVVVITQESAYLESDIAIKGILKQKFTLIFDTNNIETKTLDEWLDYYVLTERKNCSIKTLSGKRVHTMSIQVFKHIYNGGMMSEMFFERDYEIVLKNFFLEFITLLIGQEFLKNMNSSIGQLSKHEGIVLRDTTLNKTDQPVKLTGFFILKK